MSGGKLSRRRFLGLLSAMPMVITSLRPMSEFYQMPIALFPRHPSLENHHILY